MILSKACGMFEGSDKRSTWKAANLPLMKNNTGTNPGIGGDLI